MNMFSQTQNNFCSLLFDNFFKLGEKKSEIYFSNGEGESTLGMGWDCDFHLHLHSIARL